MSEFAPRLLLARSDAGLTQRELAEMTGVSTVQLSRYEGGKSIPRPPVMMKLAKALGVNHEWLSGSNSVEANETRHVEIELPADAAEEVQRMADAAGIPLDLFIKHLVFEQLTAMACDDEKLKLDAQGAAGRIRDRISKIKKVESNS